MDIKKVIVAILIISSGIFYYNLTSDSLREGMIAKVVRVIDGDTFEIEGGQKIRLKGINTPEKSMSYYLEARDFLEFLKNSSVVIENHGGDKYGRILAHVFYGEVYVNEEILKKGLGTLYYYEKDSHFGELKDAEEFARLNQLGIWKESSRVDCLELVSLKYEEDGGRCIDGEVLEIENICDFDIDVTIKDDATHIYEEKILANSVWRGEFSCIFNDAGDSLYVWDTEGLLIFYRY